MAGSSSIAQGVGMRMPGVGAGRGSRLEAVGRRMPVEALDSKLLVAAELDTEPACNR